MANWKRVVLINFAAAAWVAALAGALIARDTPRAVIHGVVIAAETGKPLPLAVVAAHGIERPWWRDLRADPEGRFELRDIPAGLASFTAHGNVHEMKRELRVDVRESSRNEVTLRLTAVAPFVRVRAADRRYQFTPDEDVTLAISGYSKSNRLLVDIRRVSLAQVRANKQSSSWSGDFRVPHSLGRKVRQQALDPVARDEEGRVVAPVRFRLPPGLYSVWASFPDAADGVVVSVSRIGLVTKFDGRRALGYVQDLVENRPVSGARVEVTSEGRVAHSGPTNSQGIYTVTVGPREIQQMDMVAVLGDSTALAQAYAYGDEESGDTRAYFYTDRPVYRPGQQVYFKAILRERRGTRYRVPVRERVHVVIEDAGGATIFEQDLLTNALGSIHGELQLSPDAAVGTCRATITARGQEDTGYFFVAEYRKPEYEVTVKAAKPHSERGEPVRFTITARYYWGEPVRNATVTYSITHTPEWYYPDDEESRFLSDFYPESEPSAYGGEREGGYAYGEEASTGQGHTDGDGRLTVTYQPQLPKDDASDYRFTLEADVGDSSRFTVTGRGSTLVTRGAFRLAIEPDRWVVAPGDPVHVVMRAVDYEGRPQVGLSVQLAPGKGAAFTLTTDSRGRATASLPTRGRGEMELVASARDSAGNLVTGRISVWVTDGSFSEPGYGYAGLEIVADRKSYRPGDTARILLNVARPGGYALFTVEGDRLYEQRVLRLEANSTLVTLPLPEAYVPNVFVSVVTVRGRQFDHQERMLQVSPLEHALNVSITADRGKLHPRDSVTFTVKTTDSRGRPVDAEVSLGLVDEAIYAVRPDPAVDGMKYFYRFRQNRVQTAYSFPEIYLADEPKDGGPTEVRKDFPDTARWFPELRTGPTGVRSVTVRLPDSLTTWRATVRAHTAATQVGAAVSRVIVSKDLFIRVETPRFLTQYDRSLVSTIVHNDTDRRLTVRVALTARGVQLDDRQPRMVDVAPSASERLDWGVSAPEAGVATFQGSAIVAGGPQDALEKSIPVVPHGAESRWGRSGELQGNAEEFTLEMPGGAIQSTTTAQVTINATPAGILLEALDYLNASDYGTTENVVGWFLPDMTVAMTFKQLGIRYEPLEKRLRVSVPRNLARLYRLQTGSTYDDSSGGGWGWAAGAGEDPFWTAYALYGLVQARKAGYAVEPAVMDRGTKALTRLLPREKDPSNRALICYVLAQAGHPARRAMDDLVSGLPDLRGKVKNYAIALLALALADLEPERARQVAAALTQTVRQQGDTAYWPEIYPWGFYSCNDNETTGYALMALIRTDPQNPLIDRAARWLIQKRQGGGWTSTEDTASITYALGAYLRLQRRLRPADYTATVRLNGQEVGSARVLPAGMFAPQTVSLPAQGLRPGPNTVRIERTGSGRVIYGISYRTFVRVESFAPEISGLQVRREYFRRLRLRDINGNRFDKMVDAGETFRPGDEIYVRLTIEVRDPDRRGECREVILRDPIPAGCEGIDEQRDLYSEYDYEDSSGNWWEGAEKRREIRDREAVFYAAYLQRGKNVFHYRFRAAIPGDYRVLPASARAAYIPEISGRTGELRVRVRD